jgi:hypothetical protein
MSSGCAKPGWRAAARSTTLIVISGDRVLNDGGLRFADEFVRHKLLDAFGDLYLAGGPIIGHFRGSRSGHAHTRLLLAALFADPDAWCATTLASTAGLPADRAVWPEAAAGSRTRLKQAGDSGPACESGRCGDPCYKPRRDRIGYNRVHRCVAPLLAAADWRCLAACWAGRVRRRQQRSRPISRSRSTTFTTTAMDQLVNADFTMTPPPRPSTRSSASIPTRCGRPRAS